MESHPAAALFILLAAAGGCSSDGRESSATGPPGVPGIGGESLPETAFDTVITAGPADGSTWEQSAATFHWVSPGARHWGWALLTAEEFSRTRACRSGPPT